MIPFRTSLDFLECRLTANSEKLKPFFELVSNSHCIVLDSGFRVSLSYSTEKTKILWLKDQYNVEVAYISLSLGVNKNSSYIQFVGHFFTMYQDYLDYFLDVFDISKYKNSVVRRFDYCFDFYYSTTELRELLYSHKGHKNEYNFDGEYSGLKIYVGDSSDTKTHEIGLYDKKLDTLRKGKYKYPIPENPYKEQLNNPGHISRMEARFFSRACRRFTENGLPNASITRILKDSKQMAYDYLKKWFLIDFPIDRTYSKISSKKDERVDRISAQKTNFYYSQAKAYMDNIRLLNSEKELFDFIRSTFPSIDDYIIGSVVQKGKYYGVSMSPIDNRGTLINKMALQKQVIFPKSYDIYQKIMLINEVIRKRIYSLYDQAFWQKK